MVAFNSSYYKQAAFLFISFVILFFVNPAYSQTNTKPEYSSLLDSVKTFYGDTCCIGVNSALIKRLYKFQKYAPVRNYLNSYESIKKTIEDFRTIYSKTIYNEKAMLLGLSRILKNNRQQNIVNACGIYLGADSVTSVALSYIIIRSSPIQYSSGLYQIANFDPLFKKEITNYGSDWYNSEKLKEIMAFPLK